MWWTNWLRQWVQVWLGCWPFHKCREDADLASLGAQLNEALFTIDKSVRVNHLSVIKQLLTPNAFFYSYLYNGKTT